MKDIDLTICSVYHSIESKRLLELNYDFVRQMNQGTSIKWIVADNTPRDFSGSIDEKKFTVVPGAQDTKPVPDWLVGSYRHSEAINNSLKFITTRFVLFLDIDFYLVRKDWMEYVTSYMQARNLGLFGVPWHPFHVSKIRYFPSHHALFVDLKKIPIASLDFRPEYDFIMHPTLMTRLARKMRKIKHAISKRMMIGMSPDTGFKLYRRFRSCAAFEYATPVFIPATDLCDIPESASVWEKIAPDIISYIPKRTGYYTEHGFGSAGFADARGEHWEEFMWEGKPYGFHVRGTHKLKNDLEGGMGKIKIIMKGFGNGVL